MSKTAKTALWIMIATTLSKILGFFREIVFGNFYGTGKLSDVFLYTLNIPGLIVAVVGAAIATTYIPLYFELKEKKGEEEALKFTNNIMNICAIITIIIAILGLIFTEEFVKVFAAGFKGDKFDLAVDFTKIMISGVLFLGVSKILSSYLQVNDNFVIPGLVGIPHNLIIIIAVVISAKTNVYVLAIGALIAMASQLFFQIPFALKKSFKYKPYLNMKDETIKQLTILAMPMVIGVGITQLNIFVDKALATGLSDGKLSALSYAGKLNEFVMALFVTSIVTVIYPKLAKMSNTDDNSGFVNTIVTSSNSITLVVMPITIGAIVLADPIVRIIYQRGAFDAQSVHMTAMALRFFSIGLLASGIRDVLYRVFYSISETKTPMINGSIALLINIVLNFALIGTLDYIGLAFSTSISSVITVVLLFRSLKKKVGYFGGDKIVKTVLKSFVSSMVMGAVAFFVFKNMSAIIGIGKIGDIVSTSAAVLIGAVVYGVLVVILKVEELDLIFDMIKKTKNKLLKR